LTLLRDKTLSDADRQQLRQDWLPGSSYAVNIFFPNWKNNPEELRGKVMYYKAPKTIFDKWVSCINRDAPDSDVDNEDDEPEAYGAFFDENASWLFELQIEMSGKSNSYKTSRFVVGADKKPIPIAKDETGAPNKKAIAAILASRVDIWSRLEVPNPAKIKTLTNNLLHGDDEPISAVGKLHVEEEDEDEVPAQKAKAVSKPVEKPVETQKPKPKSAIVEEDDDEGSDMIDSSDLDNLLGQLDDD